MNTHRVLVAGASGDTGREVLSVLRQTDCCVRALTRSESTAGQLEALADEVVVADLVNPRGAARATANVDAVVTAVGTAPTRIHRASEFVDGTGNVHLVDAAAAEGVKRFVMTSSLGVGGDRASWLARFFAAAIGPVLDAKAEAEAAIRESGLTYTILRPAVLVGNWAGGEVQVARGGRGLWGVVSRRDLADLLVASLATPAAHDRTLEVARNPLQSGTGEVIDWQLPGVPQK